MVEGRSILARGAAPMLRQVMVSVAATIIATATLTVMQQHYAAWRTQTVANMTSGGKFAARLEAMAPSGDEAAPAVFIAPQLPVLLSMPLPQLWPPSTEVAAAAEPAKRVLRGNRPESKPRPLVTASAGSATPPRRADILAEAAAPVSATDEIALWRDTKTLAHQALAFGDAIWARVTPAKWSP